MPQRESVPPGASTRAPAIAAATSAATVITATGAVACCTGPATATLIIAAVGASGAAWLAGLKPYAPYLLGGAFAGLLYAFHAMRRERRACSIAFVPRRRVIFAQVSLLLLCLAAAIWLGGVVTYVLYATRGG